MECGHCLTITIYKGNGDALQYWKDVLACLEDLGEGILRKTA